MANQQVTAKISADAGNVLILGKDDGLYVPKGQGGTSLRLLAPQASEAAIKALHAPKPGDSCLAKDSGDLWSYDGKQWNNAGHIRGDKGDKGADAPTLTAGPGITLTTKP